MAKELEKPSAKELEKSRFRGIAEAPHLQLTTVSIQFFAMSCSKVARVSKVTDLVLGDMGLLVISFLAADMSCLEEGGLVECGLPGFAEQKELQITKLRQDAISLMFTCKIFKNRILAILEAIPLPVKHMYGMIPTMPLDVLVINFNMDPDILRCMGLYEEDVQSSCIIFTNWPCSAFVGAALHGALGAGLHGAKRSYAHVVNMLNIEVAPYATIRSLEESCDECTTRAVAHTGNDWNDRAELDIRCLQVFLKPGHVVTFMFTGVDPAAHFIALEKVTVVSQQPGFYMMCANNRQVRVPFDKLNELRGKGFVLQDCESFGGSYTCDLNGHEFI